MPDTRAQRRSKRALRLLTWGLAGHLVINAWSIGDFFFTRHLPMALATARVPAERRAVVIDPVEYAAVITIRRQLPEDARILWVPVASPLVRYNIYPRKIFQYKEFLPGEDAALDPQFLADRRITHVYLAPDKIYEIRRNASRAGGQTP